MWLTPQIKRMVLEKAKIYRRYVKHGRNIADCQILRDITSRCKSAIKEAKSNYFSRLGESLNDPAITPKKYWSILHSFLYKRKIPKIPPMRHNNTFLTDTMVKANTYNSFFAKQCSLIETGSELPADYLLTHHRLESVNLDPAKILSIIRAFDVSKAHGWDDVSVRMVKICDESLVKRLFNIFQFSLETGNFPSKWKKGNIVPVHKKGNKSLISNYRPVFLLPIFIYEKCTLYNYFEGNDLFYKSQSDFRKGDSCVSQLFSIAHEVFKCFDANPSLDICGIFFDISKAFDRVWHVALIFKLRSYGISDSLLCLFNSFLSERLQRVVLNGRASEWRTVSTGVPQGSILGLLLFLIFINNIPANLECNLKIFGDDTSLFSLVRDPNK